MNLIDNPSGGYRFLPGGLPYSAGVVAAPGFEIVRATLHQPLPYRQGFALIDQHLAGQARPRAALCAIELRSPQPFTIEGFGAFNQDYRALLAAWNILVDDQNPVARTNVAPAFSPPAEPSLYAFSYTIPAQQANPSPTFVIAGMGDMQEGGVIVRAGETSPDAMREKAAFVMRGLLGRLGDLGMTLADVTDITLYTVHPLDTYLVDTILEPLGLAAVHAAHWYYSRPPIVGLEFEADLRGVRRTMRVS